MAQSPADRQYIKNFVQIIAANLHFPDSRSYPLIFLDLYATTVYFLPWQKVGHNDVVPFVKLGIGHFLDNANFELASQIRRAITRSVNLTKENGDCHLTVSRWVRTYAVFRFLCRHSSIKSLSKVLKVEFLPSFLQESVRFFYF